MPDKPKMQLPKFVGLVSAPLNFRWTRSLSLGGAIAFPLLGGLLMKTREDDKVHNNLAFTSCILSEGRWVIIQVRKCALYHRITAP